MPHRTRPDFLTAHPPAAACAALLVLATGLTSSPAQLPRPGQDQNPSGSEGQSSVEIEELPNKFWEANLPGGNFLIALGAIRFVSINEYIVDGSVRVHEVDVASDSSSLARFYYLELLGESGGITGASTLLNRAKGLAESVAERTGSEPVWKQVQKNYPTTTHSHTVEYRLQNLDDLRRLYGSVRDSWYNGQGARITVRE